MRRMGGQLVVYTKGTMKVLQGFWIRHNGALRYAQVFTTE